MKKIREWMKKRLLTEIPIMPTLPDSSGRKTYDKLMVTVGQQPRRPVPELFELAKETTQPSTVPVSVRLPYNLVKELKQFNGTMTEKLKLAATLYLGAIRQRVSCSESSFLAKKS